MKKDNSAALDALDRYGETPNHPINNWTVGDWFLYHHGKTIRTALRKEAAQPEGLREAIENLQKVMQIMCCFPDSVPNSDKRQYSVGFMRGVKMACETLIRAAEQNMGAK